MLRKILAPFLLLTCFLNAEAQEEDKVIIQQSEKLTKSKDGKVSTLEGKVALTTERLTITRADKVVIDHEGKKLFIYGGVEYTFHGKLQALSASRKAGHFEYIL